MVPPPAENNTTDDSDTTPHAVLDGTTTDSVYSALRSGAGSLAVITGGLECLNGGHELVDLPWLLHPTGMHVMGSIRAGCVVGNLLVTLGWFALLCLAMAAISAWQSGSPLHLDWANALSYLRFPSSGGIVPLLFLPGTIDSSLTLATGGEEGLSPGHAVLGVGGLIYSTSILSLLWLSTTDASFGSRLRDCSFHPSESNCCTRYIFGSRVWESAAGRTHTERMGLLFENYSEGNSWLRRNGRYLLVEAGQVPLLVGLSAIGVSTWGGCAVKAFVTAAVFAGLTAISFGVFLAPFLNHIVIGANAASSLGMACFGVVFILEDPGHPLLLVGALLLALGMLLSTMRSAYDIVTYIMDLFRYFPKERCEVELEDAMEESLLFGSEGGSPNSRSAYRLADLDLTSSEGVPAGKSLTIDPYDMSDHPRCYDSASGCVTPQGTRAPSSLSIGAGGGRSAGGTFRGVGLARGAFSFTLTRTPSVSRSPGVAPSRASDEEVSGAGCSGYGSDEILGKSSCGVPGGSVRQSNVLCPPLVRGVTGRLPPSSSGVSGASTMRAQGGRRVSGDASVHNSLELSVSSPRMVPRLNSAPPSSMSRGAAAGVAKGPCRHLVV